MAVTVATAVTGTWPSCAEGQNENEKEVSPLGSVPEVPKTHDLLRELTIRTAPLTTSVGGKVQNLSFV